MTTKQETQHTPKLEAQGSAIVALTGFSESWNKQVPASPNYSVIATINQNLEDWDTNQNRMIKAWNAYESNQATIKALLGVLKLIADRDKGQAGIEARQVVAQFEKAKAEVKK